MQTDSRLLHRILGLTVLRVGTGHESRGHSEFALDAVEAAQVPSLRAMLLADSVPASEPQQPTGRVLAQWRPSWLRYAPLSFSGVVMLAAVIGLAYQAGVGVKLSERAAKAGAEAAHRTGVVVVLSFGAVALVLASVILAVGWSWLTYGGLVLRRDDGVLHLRHGLLRIREHTFDMRRLRGATLREPLLVRLLRGARLDAVMTGVHGEGESSVLLPACPASTAKGVMTELVENADAVSAPLSRHGPAASRRRWTRALVLPVLGGIVLLVVVNIVALLPVWAWVLWAVVMAACAVLAVDRARSLGHRVASGWLVTRTGSLERRRDCIACDGIIAWTVRQTLLQRRAGVATLVAATAAGRKRYEVIDVPAERAWSVAAEASPWVAQSIWAPQTSQS